MNTFNDFIKKNASFGHSCTLGTSLLYYITISDVTPPASSACVKGIMDPQFSKSASIAMYGISIWAVLRAEMSAYNTLQAGP